MSEPQHNRPPRWAVPPREDVPARVQGGRPPFERLGPLPPEVREHLRAGVGARVKALRRDRGWTQQQLADRIGWSIKVVGRMECGVHRPTYRQLAAVAKALEPRRETSKLLAQELAGLAAPYIRGRMYRGVPTVRADVERQLVKVERLTSRLRSVRPTKIMPSDRHEQDR